MLTRVTVEIPQALLLELLAYLKTRRDQCNVDRATNEALRVWLQAQTGQPPVGPAMRGYQWKMLFLPEGTCLRSWSHGEHNYAQVVGDEIIHMGRSVTPNQFARSFERTVRTQLLADEVQPATTTASAAPGRKPAKPAETSAHHRSCSGESIPGWDLPERRKYRIRLEDFE